MDDNMEQAYEEAMTQNEKCQKMLDDLKEGMKDFHERLREWNMVLDKNAQQEKEFKEQLNKTHALLNQPLNSCPNEPITKPPPSPRNDA